MKMKIQIQNSIIRTFMLLMIVAAASIFPVYAAGSIVNKELIKTSSPLASLGVGDKLYLLTYSDGTQEYSIEKQKLFQGLFITNVEGGTTLTTPIGGEAIYHIQLYGISSVLDGLNYHTHELEIKDSSGMVVFSKQYVIYSSNIIQEYYTTYVSLGFMPKQGTFTYKVQEYVYMANGAKARASTETLTVVVGNGINPTPQPTYQSPTPYPTYQSPNPYPTYQSPTPQPTYQSPQPTTPPKPVIIPPSVTKFISDLWLSFKSIFGLSISGGQAVNIPTGKVYSTAINLAFNTPDSDYSDGTYQTIFAEWFIADSLQTVKYESGWQQLTIAPYGTAASFTPQTDGKYYLIAVVVRQDYKWDATTQKWSSTETIETKEVQELTAKLNAPAPAPVTQPTTTSRGILASLWTWVLGLVGW